MGAPAFSPVTAPHNNGASAGPPVYTPAMPRLNSFSHVTISKHRIEGLADAVLAIVVTLLVLEFKIPEIPHHPSSAELLGELRHLGPTVFAYFVTFALAGSYWFLHHLSMHFIKQANQKMAFLNLGFLCFVSLFPFSAALLGHYVSSPVAQAIYFLNQFCAIFFLLWNWYYARSAGLLAEIDAADAHRLATHMRGLAIATFSAAVATFFTRQSFIVFVLAIVLNRALSRLRRPHPVSRPAE